MCSTLLHKGTTEAIEAKRRTFIWTGDTTCTLGGGNARQLGTCRTDLFPALLSFCPRTNITVAHAYLQEQWLIPLHPHLTSVASSQLGAIQLALADVALLPHVPDRRGIGNDLQPFSSHGFYLWHMEQRPIDSFSDCIWSNATILKFKHFLWLYCGAYEDQDRLLLRCPLACGELWDLPYFSDEVFPRTRSIIITDVLRNVWKAHNSVVFNSLFPTVASTCLAIHQDLQLWSIRM
ncbi:hypothetical protein PVAP13_3NG303906 [Panicum virgatum]|uniref:Uncharacterized protein n=1 Tax=Panicum virgatum TaxID=38727 RepID=A0A8T0UH86_PANVG|nr:hypothetical protein PVAP13_3NG303906 [Panicum virgatum]